MNLEWSFRVHIRWHLPKAAKDALDFTIDNYLLTSVSGLVVKFVVAIDEPGVRFPPDARGSCFFSIFFRSYNFANSAAVSIRLAPTCMKHIVFRTSTSF